MVFQRESNDLLGICLRLTCTFNFSYSIPTKLPLARLIFSASNLLLISPRRPPRLFKLHVTVSSSHCMHNPATTANFNPAVLLPQYSNTEPMNQSHPSIHDNTPSSAPQLNMMNAGQQLSSYGMSSLFAPTYYPVSATDIHGDFAVLGSMYEDSYTSQSSGQLFYYDSIYRYRRE